MSTYLHKEMRFAIPWLLTVVLAPGVFGGSIREGIPNQFTQKKLIAAGWDSPTPDILLEHLKEIDQTPFDGIRINVIVTGEEGTKVDTGRIFNATPWKREWFRSDIELLRKAKSDKLTDNFLSVGPGSSLDWFDDAGWEQVVDHFRIVAWIAKEAGLKGIFFNPEVGIKLPAFSYNRQIEREQHSFAEYAAKVRERGEAVMKAMAEEYPDMVLFSMFLNGGQAYNAFYQDNGIGASRSNYYFDGAEMKAAGPAGPLEVQEQTAPLERIEGGSYNLLAAFLNGWLDAVPPVMTIVDGLENTYTATDRQHFIKWAHNVHTLGLQMVSPENRLKYRRQVQAGFGIYLDCYFNKPGPKYYIGPAPDVVAETEAEIQKARIERLGSVVRSALEVTDEYVWLWGEKHRWWPSPLKRVSPKSWEEMSPGVTDALNEARDPTTPHKRKYREAYQQFSQLHAHPTKNLIKDGDFAANEGSLWSLLPSEGAVDHDRNIGRSQHGSICLSASQGGFYQRSVAIPKSDGSALYGIRAWVRTEGAAKPQIRVRWKKDDGPFLFGSADNIYLAPLPNKAEGEWRLIEGIVAPPAKRNRIVIQLLSQAEGNERVWFDDIEVYRID